MCRYDRGAFKPKRQEVGLVINVRTDAAYTQVKPPLLQCSANPIWLGNKLLDQILDRADLLHWAGANVVAPVGGVEEVQIQVLVGHQVSGEALGVLADARKRR